MRRKFAAGRSVPPETVHTPSFGARIFAFLRRAHIRDDNQGHYLRLWSMAAVYDGVRIKQKPRLAPGLPYLWMATVRRRLPGNVSAAARLQPRQKSPAVISSSFAIRH
jgi:hypothetical protein